jgi:hypothetical protein
VGIHQTTHPEFVEGCFLCKASTISVAPSATPSRNGGQEAATVNAREARWDKDMPAYKELRRQGLQPRQIDGAHELTGRAKDRMEVEMGHVFKTPGQLAAAKEGMAHAQQIKSDNK